MAATIAPAGCEYAPAARRRVRTAPRARVDAALTALLAALAAVALVVVALAAAGIRPRIEMSDSMRPALRAGDLVWLRAIAARDARAGDVIAFADPARRRVVMHRVLRVAPRAGDRLAFVTRGDANTGTERWRIAATGAIGRYAGLRLPAAGRVVAAAHGPVLALLAVLSGLGVAGLVLQRIWAA